MCCHLLLQLGDSGVVGVGILYHSATWEAHITILKVPKTRNMPGKSFLRDSAEMVHTSVRVEVCDPQGALYF